jgi:hypothetical protein
LCSKNHNNRWWISQYVYATWVGEQNFLAARAFWIGQRRSAIFPQKVTPR